LKDCIDMALQNNSSVRNAERQMNIAGTDVMTARAAILPTVNTSFSSGRFRRGEQVLVDDVCRWIFSTTWQSYCLRKAALYKGGFSR
jgi:outer membrane protein TolC